MDQENLVDMLTPTKTNTTTEDESQSTPLLCVTNKTNNSVNSEINVPLKKNAFNTRETGSRPFSRAGHSLSNLSFAPTIEDFNILKPISRGAFGKVFLGCR